MKRRQEVNQLMEYLILGKYNALTKVYIDCACLFVIHKISCSFLLEGSICTCIINTLGNTQLHIVTCISYTCTCTY